MSNYSALYLMSMLAVTSYFVGTSGKGFCDSPQYLEYGKTGTINCSFHDQFFGVLWYNTTEYATNDPLVDYQSLLKTGTGYTSGEFDVAANGSLIINHVTLEHERTFVVVYFHSEDGLPQLIDIEIFVVVKPSVPFPVFDQCGNISNSCYASFSEPSLRCSVPFSRPAISLQIFVRTVTGDRDISDNATINPEGIGYASRVISTDVFKFSNFLSLLVCKASASPGILKNKESYLLAQNGDINLSFKDGTLRYVELNSRMELSCETSDISFIVWKKYVSLEDENPEVLLYSVNTGEQLTKIFANDVTLENNSSLVLSKTTVKHNGHYYCLFGDGLTDGTKFYDVVVVAYPIPAYPVIDGCNHEQYCVLEAENEGNLTCTLKGIHPKVHLVWQAVYNDDVQAISFSNNQVTVKDNGETFDVTLTSTYTLNHEARDRLTIECKVSSPNEIPFNLTTQIDLLLVKPDIHPTDQNDLPSTPNSLTWIIPVIAAIAVIAVSGILLTLCRNRFNKRKDERHGPERISVETEERTTMLPMKTYDANTILDLKDLFLKQIKAKYKDWYDAVQPIPYIKDRLYCVDKVFVEGGIEVLESVEGVGRRGFWKILETYENVFNSPQASSIRRILEGEPGYGKSTIALQFAYDWCNPRPTSCLKDVEILMLLRLRQLGGVPSIYKAIKLLLLPRDTTIIETDIEYILRKSKSVVVILDGFDEYPDQDSTTITDVMTIIARQMFQDFDVVTTTRSSFLPKKYPPLTKRIRLTGFDDKARRYYIRKAVVGDDDEGVRKIEGYLEENPMLSDLCQVPLLFVIFAHMTYESEQFCKLDSVTSFFRYMISCFHSHMRNKMDDENVRKYGLFETDHRDLDRVAFEAFSGQSQRIVWEKDEISRQIGQEFYEQYLRIGILVEDEVTDIIGESGTLISEHVQYKRKVMFYHKLFCEWYAAHYVADFLQENPNLDLREFFRYIDPFDVQYLFRFACGLNPMSAKRIIDYLQKIEGGDKFTILCILEQTGKSDNIKATIRQLCDEGVIISGHDNRLLQRSSLQLLELAARKKIPIKYVNLDDCFQSVDLSKKAIRTTSGLTFTSRIAVENLAVTLYNREMTEDEAIAILEFSSMCPSLCHLRFGGSVPPLKFKTGAILSALKAKTIKVFWRMKKGYQWYVLNLETGRWQNEVNKKEPNDAMFQRMRSRFHQNLETASEDFYRDEVQKMRCRMRKYVEQRSYSNGDGSNKDDKVDGYNVG